MKTIIINGVKLKGAPNTKTESYNSLSVKNTDELRKLISLPVDSVHSKYMLHVSRYTKKCIVMRYWLGGDYEKVHELSNPEVVFK